MTRSDNKLFDIRPAENQKPKVLIDLDGVARDFIGSLVRVYKREFPGHQVEAVSSRKLEDFFPIGKEIYQFMENGHIEEIMVEADPYPGAVEALKKWDKHFKICVVTAQPDISRAPTYMWIAKHQIPADEVHITYHKSGIEGIALLDDFDYNLEEFAATDRLAVCLDQRWNQNWQGARVHTVDEFFQFLMAKRTEEKLKI